MLCIVMWITSVIEMLRQAFLTVIDCNLLKPWTKTNFFSLSLLFFFISVVVTAMDQQLIQHFFVSCICGPSDHLVSVFLLYDGWWPFRHEIQFFLGLKEHKKRCITILDQGHVSYQIVNPAKDQEMQVSLRLQTPAHISLGLFHLPYA